eukprot:GHVL01034622.1.p1 GENE.GHVL01034622.1~~GHVL01034622.1.p1  ORF type:complete len:1316 (+),score=370.78 GHVL01034622.1:538-3948(+)
MQLTYFDVEQLPEKMDQIIQMSYSPRRDYLVSVLQSGDIVVWKIEIGQFRLFDRRKERFLTKLLALASIGVNTENLAPDDKQDSSTQIKGKTRSVGFWTPNIMTVIFTGCELLQLEFPSLTPVVPLRSPANEIIPPVVTRFDKTDDRVVVDVATDIVTFTGYSFINAVAPTPRRAAPEMQVKLQHSPSALSLPLDAPGGPGTSATDSSNERLALLVRDVNGTLRVVWVRTLGVVDVVRRLVDNELFAEALKFTESLLKRSDIPGRELIPKRQAEYLLEEVLRMRWLLSGRLEDHPLSDFESIFRVSDARWIAEQALQYDSFFGRPPGVPAETNSILQPLKSDARFLQMKTLFDFSQKILCESLGGDPEKTIQSMEDPDDAATSASRAFRASLYKSVTAARDRLEVFKCLSIEAGEDGGSWSEYRACDAYNVAVKAASDSSFNLVTAIIDKLDIEKEWNNIINPEYPEKSYDWWIDILDAIPELTPLHLYEHLLPSPNGLIKVSLKSSLQWYLERILFFIDININISKLILPFLNYVIKLCKNYETVIFETDETEISSIYLLLLSLKKSIYQYLHLYNDLDIKYDNIIYKINIYINDDKINLKNYLKLQSFERIDVLLDDESDIIYDIREKIFLNDETADETADEETVGGSLEEWVVVGKEKKDIIINRFKENNKLTFLWLDELLTSSIDNIDILKDNLEKYKNIIYVGALDNNIGAVECLSLCVDICKSLIKKDNIIYIITDNTQIYENISIHAGLWGFGRSIRNNMLIFNVDIQGNTDIIDSIYMISNLYNKNNDNIYLETIVRDNKCYCRSEHAYIKDPKSTSIHGPMIVDIDTRGALANLQVNQLTDDSRIEPGVNEVEIRVRAVGLNFRDVLNVMGLYPGNPGPPGSDCAGTVVRVGKNVKHLKAGDDVFGVAAGCIKTYVTTHCQLQQLKPKSLSYEEASALPVIFVTVMHCFEDIANLSYGQKVIIHTASGGVGLAALQYCKQVKAIAYCTVGNDKKAQHLLDEFKYTKNNGCIQYISTSRNADKFKNDMYNELKDDGVDVVLNTLTGDYISNSVNLLKNNGIFLEIGKRDIWTIDEMLIYRNNIIYRIIAVDTSIDTNPEWFGKMLKKLAEKVEEKFFTSLPLETFNVQ